MNPLSQALGGGSEFDQMAAKTGPISMAGTGAGWSGGAGPTTFGAPAPQQDQGGFLQLLMMLLQRLGQGGGGAGIAPNPRSFASTPPSDR